MTTTPFKLVFTKGTDMVTYTDDDNTMTFRMNNPTHNYSLTADTPDAMNFMMNLLATAGYECDSVVI